MRTTGGRGLGARFRQHYAERARQEARQRWGDVAVVTGGREAVRRVPVASKGPDGPKAA